MINYMFIYWMLTAPLEHAGFVQNQATGHQAPQHSAAIVPCLTFAWSSHTMAFAARSQLSAKTAAGRPAAHRSRCSLVVVNSRVLHGEHGHGHSSGKAWYEKHKVRRQQELEETGMGCEGCTCVSGHVHANRNAEWRKAMVQTRWGLVAQYEHLCMHVKLDS